MSASSGAAAGDGRITRRDFNRRAVRSAAGMLLAAAEPALPADKDDMTPSDVPADDAELTAVLTLVRAAAPHLPESDLDELKTQVEGVLAAGRRLRARPVPEGAEPDFVFHALLPEPRP